jgi:hypothetical protein
MPVSSPSYFPPARGTDQIVGLNAGQDQLGARVFLAGKGAGQYTGVNVSDIIVIGDAALDAGTLAAPITEATFAGSIIVGSGAATSLTSPGAAGLTGANTVIGYNALAAALYAGTNVLIGDNVASAYPGASQVGALSANVYIGSQVFAGGKNTPGSQSIHSENVVIGYEATMPPGTTPYMGVNDCVVIGSGALSGSVGTTINGTCSFGNGVYIGRRCGYGSNNANNVNNETWVGAGITGSNSYSRGDNTCVGYNIVMGAANANFSTMVGSGASGCTQYGSILGAKGNANGHKGVVLLGAGAGSSGTSIAADDVFLLETVRDDGNRRCLLYGVLGQVAGASQGGLIVGASTQGTDRDLPTNSYNILKLLNGHVGTVNPVGGGYLYCTAGALHWVGTSGTDTQLASA